MSQDTAQLLWHIVALWNAGEPESAVEWLDPEVEIHTPFSSVTGEPYHGVDGYRRWRSDITEQFELWEMNVREIRQLADQQLLAIGYARVRGRGSGVEFEQPAAGLVDLREGRVLRLSIFLSEHEALRAAGLRG